MKIRISYLIFLSVLISLIPTQLRAGTRQKYYNAKIYTVDGKIVRGILSAVNENGIYLNVRRSAEPQLIDPASIRQIKLIRKSKSSTGSLIGFISGAAISTGTILALDLKDKYDVMRVAGGVLFTFTTTAIGGAIASKPDAVITINGRPDDFLQNLNRLKSFATQR